MDCWCTGIDVLVSGAAGAFVTLLVVGGIAWVCGRAMRIW